jgi:hypothetical protein
MLVLHSLRRSTRGFNLLTKVLTRTCHAAFLDDLFICDAYDASGVHVLTRSSGMHFERHPLIRCLTPEMDDDSTSAAEKRLIPIEGRLNDMQTHFDDINDRFDDLSSRIGDLDGRFCNIEQLLHRLVVAVKNST